MDTINVVPEQPIREGVKTSTCRNLKESYVSSTMYAKEANAECNIQSR